MGSLGSVELRYLDLVLDAMVGHLTGQIGNQGESQRPIYHESFASRQKHITCSDQYLTKNFVTA